jgi:hypothetical protein
MATCLVSLLLPEGHFHFIDVDQVCRYHMYETCIPYLVRMVFSFLFSLALDWPVSFLVKGSHLVTLPKVLLIVST